MEKEEIKKVFGELAGRMHASVKEVLEFTRSEKMTREMFEMVLKRAQKEFADEHIDEIMRGVESGLDKMLGRK
jgi:hypothetical protein